MNLQKIDSPQISEGISANTSDLVGVDEEQLQGGQPVEDLCREAGNPVAVENPVVKKRKRNHIIIIRSGVDFINVLHARFSYEKNYKAKT